MEGSIVITLVNIQDGFCEVHIKPAVGRSYYREFSQAGLNEYLEETRNYCKWKGYEFTYKDETEEIIEVSEMEGTEYIKSILDDLTKLDNQDKSIIMHKLLAWFCWDKEFRIKFTEFLKQVFE